MRSVHWWMSSRKRDRRRTASRFPLRCLPAFIGLAVAALGFFGCAGPDGEQVLPDCASRTLSTDAMRDAPAVTDTPLELLLTERPDIRDVDVSFSLRPAGADTMPADEPVEFELGVSNGTNQAVVLFFPRPLISLGGNLGTIRLTLLDGYGYPVNCGWIAEIPDGAFEPQNYIELPPRSQCEWRLSLSADYADCWPIKDGLPLPPDQYTMWYEYRNVSVGPIVPFSENPTTEPLRRDVHALLGVKRSNRVDFTIVESQGE
jgi:hypothetical protein